MQRGAGKEAVRAPRRGTGVSDGPVAVAVRHTTLYISVAVCVTA